MTNLKFKPVTIQKMNILIRMIKNTAMLDGNDKDKVTEKIY